MVKAASLAYAIFISLIIGILCSALLLVFSLNLSLNDYYEVQSRLHQNNQSAVALLLADRAELKRDRVPVNLFQQDKIENHFMVEPWGVFEKWKIASFYKRDTVQRSFLVSNKRQEDAPTLFLRNDGGELKIAGKTTIKGDIKVPNGKVKKVTISSNTSLFDAKHNGVVRPSGNSLPKLENLDFELPEGHRFFLKGDLEGNTHINPFHKPTWVIEWDSRSRVENINLKGNIVLVSQDTLYVHESSSLEDIIIKAPKVVFERGFKGSLQAVASSNITVRKDVVLDYPSVLMVKSERDDEEKSIVLEDESLVSGNVILQGYGLVSEDKYSMEISKEAIVRGTVYCDGKLSLYGKVEGSVYCSAFFHKTPSTTYDNLILDVEIIGDGIPDEFFTINFDESEASTPLIVKKI